MSKVRILFQPDHFIEGVKCPYCKQETVGVIPVGSEGMPRYMVMCLYESCVTNARSPIGIEFDRMVKDALGYPSLAEERLLKAAEMGMPLDEETKAEILKKLQR